MNGLMTAQAYKIADRRDRLATFDVRNHEAIYAEARATGQDPEKAAFWHKTIGRVLQPSPNKTAPVPYKSEQIFKKISTKAWLTP